MANYGNDYSTGRYFRRDNADDSYGGYGSDFTNRGTSERSGWPSERSGWGGSGRGEFSGDRFRSGQQGSGQFRSGQGQFGQGQFGSRQFGSGQSGSGQFGSDQGQFGEGPSGWDQNRGGQFGSGRFGQHGADRFGSSQRYDGGEFGGYGGARSHRGGQFGGSEFDRDRDWYGGSGSESGWGHAAGNQRGSHFYDREMQGRGGFNRQDYDQDFGDRLREGWNRFRSEARNWMGRGYDRGW